MEGVAMSLSVFRDARLRRGMTVDDVARRAGLPPPIAEHIDAGHLDRLPPGVYARSFVRAFAAAVGLDPKEALDAVSPDLPAEPDPFPFLREIVRARPPESVVEVAAEWLEGWLGTRPATKRGAAACLDAVILLSFCAWLTTLTAWFCDVDVSLLVRSAGGTMIAVCLVVWTLYFLCAGIGGVTPGLWLCGAAPTGDGRPLGLPEVFRRAQELWLEQ